MAESKIMKIALPTMLHSEDEIRAYEVARNRISKLMQTKGILVEVGVFNYMIPRFNGREAREAQLRNQTKHKLPILHTELPIMNQYSLIHDEADEELFGIKSGLEETIEHAAKLIELSPASPASDIDTHAGVFVYPSLEEDHPYPGSYSVNGFLKQREEILKRAKQRFDFLNSIAGKHDLKLTLENEPLANFEPAGPFKGRPALMYKPLSTQEALRYMSSGVQTFDINHFGATKNVPARMRMNKVDPAELFRVLGVSSWAEYQKKFTDQSAYFPKTTTAVHVSNTEGIGVHLTKPEDIRKWGADGTNEGTISREDLRATMDLARQRGLPVVIEVDYELKGKNFKEADRFLEHVYRDE